MIDDQVEMNFHPRHGTVMQITGAEYLRLAQKWGGLEHFGVESKASGLRSEAIMIGGDRVTLRAGASLDLGAFDPRLEAALGAIQPQGPQDFTDGPLAYTLAVDEAEFEFQVEAAEWNNPVLKGYYADPDIIYSERDQKYYLYPTTDGHTGWSGSDFSVFSSTDLINWTDEGVILDLKTDVSWCDIRAWAPCAIERKVGDAYKYYHYFSGDTKVGVAVSDSPTGPFKDSGKPLVDSYPLGARGGQHIDPDVFHDPESGNYYLYWGNGYLAVAELNDDMVSLKPGTTQVITPDNTFREGVHVFYRNGTYYFHWSEDDTRSPNYRVRYAMAESPTGPLLIPRENLVVARDDSQGIYGTGHNSTIQIPGKDEWYLVYHRFNYPRGITMGRAAGYHREVCVDPMTFDAAGKIIRVKPTHKGIAGVK